MRTTHLPLTALPLAALLLLAAAVLAPVVHAADEPPTAAPGTLVRWSAPGVTACAMAGERFAPLGETCVYPLDLLAEPGPVEVAIWIGNNARTAQVDVEGYPYPVQRIEIEDDGKVNLSAADLARAGRESERIDALWGSRGPRRFTLPLAAPLADLPEGGRFGSRRFFNGQPRNPHTGADYKARSGTPVLAAAAGRAVLVGDLFFSGKSVFLDHGDGLVTMYFHLSQTAVAEGDEVARGETIGEVGSTGRSSGPHLHFGVRWRGARVDPRSLLGEVGALEGVEGR